MSARKKIKIQALGAATGGGGGGAYSVGALHTWAKKPRSRQHTVRVLLDSETARGDGDHWCWMRTSANRVGVAMSPRTWDQKRHCIDAARSEARLTGARLVIDGEEVTV